MDAFLQSLPWDKFVDVAAPHFNWDRAQAEGFLRALQGEAKLGHKLISPYLKPGMKVLEVGAGMGLLSAYLESQGVHITALEPGLGGFGVNAALARAADFQRLTRVDIPAQELRGVDYDFIYSINVLEHIPDLQAALQGLARVLSPGGQMVHTCPNYLLPFEPHFGIPLVPLWPRLTAHLLPKLKASELWQSLNFVTLPQMRRAAHKAGLEAKFESGVLYRAFERLDTDPAFRERQAKGLVKYAYHAFKRTGTLSLLKRLPPVLATPMVFHFRRLTRP